MAVAIIAVVADRAATVVMIAAAEITAAAVDKRLAAEITAVAVDKGFAAEITVDMVAGPTAVVDITVVHMATADTTAAVSISNRLCFRAREKRRDLFVLPLFLASRCGR